MFLKRKYFICTLLVHALFVQPASSAQVKITVDDAVKTALANNREYKIAQIRAGEAKEQVTLAWNQLMPSIESEAALTRQHKKMVL